MISNNYRHQLSLKNQNCVESWGTVSGQHIVVPIFDLAQNMRWMPFLTQPIF